MFGFELLDVLIGMALIYFILSILCSAVTEIIAGLFKLRNFARLFGFLGFLGFLGCLGGWFFGLGFRLLCGGLGGFRDGFLF